MRDGLFDVSALWGLIFGVAGKGSVLAEENSGQEMQPHVSGTAYQAKVILGAWHSGDRNRLCQELDRVDGMEAIGTAEEERLELLCEIARELRDGRNESADAVYGSLLEHLASSGQPSRARRITRLSGYGWAAAATVLQ
jgi:hypothetical protein